MHTVQPLKPAKDGVGPREFPHPCPYALSSGGIAAFECFLLTQLPGHNRNGCCGFRGLPPCNSYLRKCVFCVAEGRRGHDANDVMSPDWPCCFEHRNRKFDKSLVYYPVDPQLLAQNALALKRKKEELRQAQESLNETLMAIAIKNIERLNERQKQIFKRRGLGESDEDIGHALGTTREAVMTACTSIYTTLGLGYVHRLDRHAAMIAVAKRYFATDPLYKARYG